jgi:signal transduction histidine kinase
MPTSRALFHLCGDIFRRQALSEASLGFLGDQMEERSAFLIADEEAYLHPSDFRTAPVAIIWETIKHDRSGIFCRRLEEVEGATKLMICATYLGRDAQDKEVAAAFMYASFPSRVRNYDEIYYERIGRLKRYYSDFIKSAAVMRYLNDRHKFRYVVDVAHRETIARETPISADSDAFAALGDRIVSDSFLRQVLSDACEDSGRLTPDSRVRKFGVDRFALLDHEYALLSFELSPIDEIGDRENSRVIRNFSHKIRNKVLALQSAAEQLSIEGEKKFNKDDRSLLGIIQSASENVDLLVTRLNQYGASNEINLERIDLNDIVGKAIKEVASETSPSPKISISAAPDIDPLWGDPVQLKTAIKELARNAAEAAPDNGVIQVAVEDSGDAVSIKIGNKIPPSMECEDSRTSLISEPYTTAKQDRAGLGISIARKIIQAHQGNLVIERTQGNWLSAVMELPKSAIGEKIT